MQTKYNLANNKAQVWIETVLYTVVILAIIAIVLSFVIPKLNEGRDKLIIEQSKAALKDLDRTIYDVAKQTGNVRIVEFNLKRGTLYLYPQIGTITLTISGLQSVYSEPGEKVNDGRIEMVLTKGEKTNSINLTLFYDDVNLVFDGKNETAQLNSYPNPYTLSLENTGRNISIKEVI